MNDTVLILIRQILQMFLLGSLGFLLYRGKKITQEGSRALANILIYLALPATIINGFLVERTPEHLAGILYSAIGGAVLLLLSILVSRLFSGRTGSPPSPWPFPIRAFSAFRC